MKKLVIVLLLAAACGGSKKAEREAAAANIVGTPPTPDEDPFFYVARPPVDAKADRQGTIGDVEPEAKQTERDKPKADTDVPPNERMQRLESQLALARAQKEEAEARAIELRAKNVELRGELADARRGAVEAPAKKSDLAQCHSCVKLCPLKGKCDDDAELVCGWGAGKTRKNARQRATSECDGALQSMRQSGAFSRIAGTCPVATCIE